MTWLFPLLIVWFSLALVSRLWSWVTGMGGEADDQYLWGAVRQAVMILLVCVGWPT